MDANFTFWFPSFWSMFGGLVALCSLLFTLYSAFSGRDRVVLLLRSIGQAYDAIHYFLGDHRVVLMDVGTLMKTLAPHGELVVEVFRNLPQLMIDVQTLASIAREAREWFERSRTDPQAPVTPVLLEILAELRKDTHVNPKVQRELPAFSLRDFLKAQAEALARERTQANPNPFHDLD